MKEKFRKPYIFMLTIAMIFTMIMAFAACDSESNKNNTLGASSEPKIQPTTVPGTDMTLAIEGPTELTAQDTVKYTVSVTECNVSDGLIGVDFTVEYNMDLLTYVGAELVKSPSETWEAFDRTEVEGQRIFSCFDDSNDEITPVTGGDQFVIEITFTVTDKPESDNNTIAKLINVTGAVNDDVVSTGYGTGNEVTKA